MKSLLFIILFISANLYAAPAPGNKWLKSAWHAKRIFPKSQAAASSFFMEEDSLALQMAVFANYTLLSADTAGKPPATHKKALKYFPTLLRDGMGVNFDPTKYRPLKPLADDSITTTAQQTTLNQTTKKITPIPLKGIATIDTAAAATQRITNLVNTYQVNSPDISIQLFDDGQIDGDAVSVYYNGKLVINNQTLSHKALTFSIEASATNRHHELILVAESEGFVAPNTALMRIKAGSQQFELNVSSSSTRNAKIAIDYTGE